MIAVTGILQSHSQFYVTPKKNDVIHNDSYIHNL